MFFHTKGLKYVTIGWTGFIAENFILSQNRTEIINEIGDSNYHLLYNSLSSIACCSILFGFVRYARNTGPLMNKFFPKYSVESRVSKSIKYGSRVMGLTLFSQCIPKLQIPVTTIKEVDATGNRFKARCPMEFTKEKGISGVKRITRYPELCSFGLFSFSFAISPLLNHFVFFSWPLIVCVLGGLHQDWRFQRGIGGYLSPSDYNQSSFIPFVALLTGRQSWSDFLREFKGLNSSIALISGILI